MGVGLLCTPLHASASYENIDIRLDGNTAQIGALLIGTTTYVPFDDANTAFSNGTARIGGSTDEMYAESPFVTVRAGNSHCYIEAEGRYIGASKSVEINGMLYVPIRSLAKAYGADVKWDDDTRSVDVYRSSKVIESGDKYYRADEVYWLSRIISAEARGESMEGKILVGNVILNRVKSPEFPDTIYGVIFDNRFGVQFTPTADKSIYVEPTADSVIAAKICLDGYSLSDKALYFLNPAWATSFWVPNNRPYIMTVGSHDFYA